MGWFILALLILLIMLPLAAVIIQVLLPGIFFGELVIGDLSLLLEIFKRPLWQASLKNSVTLGIGTTIFATLLGGFLASIRSRWTFPTARLLDATVWLLIITPSFILAQGWVMFASADGLAKQWFGWNWVNDLIFQPFGLILVMTLSKFPLAYLTIYTAMEWKVDQLRNAARMCGGSPWRVWRTVQFPLMLPAFFSGAMLVFMDTVGDFGLPASIATVFRFPTLPYSIYTALYTSPIRFDMAGVLSFYLVLLIALAMSVQLFIMRKARFDFLKTGAKRSEAKRPHKGTFLLTIGNLLFLAIVLGIPIGSTVLMSLRSTTGNVWTLEHYYKLFSENSSFFEGIIHSLEIATVAGLIGLVVGFFVAYVLTYTQFGLRRTIDVISLVSLAVPGVVLGIGYIFVWNQPWLEPIGLLLYGTPWILALASVAGAIPINTRIIVGAMTKVSNQLLAAAQMQGANFLRRLTTILAPLLKKSLVSAGLAAFGATVFDLAVTSILFPPNFMTLPVIINKAFEDLKFGYASAATIVGGSLVIIIIWIAEWFLRTKQPKQQDSRKEISS